MKQQRLRDMTQADARDLGLPGARMISIRFTLGVVICLMGLMIMSLNIAYLAGSALRLRDVQRTRALAVVDQSLFQAGHDTRWERGTGLVALAAEEAAGPKDLSMIAENHERAEAAMAASMDGLIRLRQPALEGLYSKLKAAHDAYLAFRPRLDAGLRLRKASRDPALARDLAAIGDTLSETIRQTGDVIEASLILADPVVDHLLSVKKAAWEAYSHSAYILLRSHAALAEERSWTRAEMLATATEQGQQDFAWSLVKAAVARPDAPVALVDAVARASDGLDGPFRTQQIGMLAALHGDAQSKPVPEETRIQQLAVNISIADVANVATTEMVARSDAIRHAASHDLIRGILTFLTACVLIAAGLIVVQFRVTRPILTLASAMRRLAAGDVNVEIPRRNRRDEIGTMAETVVVFRDSMIRAQNLAAEQALERESKERRVVLLTSLISNFEQQAGNSVNRLTTASVELERTARFLAGTARSTNHRAATVAAAAGQTSVGVQGIATAAAQLRRSIEEIGLQVDRSTAMTGQVVSDVRRTNGIVGALAQSAQSIGDVVGLITKITAQTKLLALNATIEAANSGTSRKGFAVVAAEVKALAGKTGTATEEIAKHIKHIQAATVQAVTAIQDITSIIEDVGSIAVVISTAVGQQDIATAEIARNVQQAAVDTVEVTETIARVNNSAEDTGSAAERMLAAAESLAEQARSLTSEIQAFVEGVQAA